MPSPEVDCVCRRLPGAFAGRGGTGNAADSFGQNAPAGISATSSANPQAAQAPVPVADSFGLNRGIAATDCRKPKAIAQPAAKAQKC